MPLSGIGVPPACTAHRRGSMRHAGGGIGPTPLQLPRGAVTSEKIISYILTTLSAVMENLSIEPRRISSSDRRVLQEIILPYFEKDMRFQKILFVGCAAYTRWYEKFFATKEYWTIDYKKIKRKYGSQNHITDNITHLEKYFHQNYFDVIMMNGVIGYGLNHIVDIEAAIVACFLTLDRGGIFVLGWNDHKRR
ncbi:MAG: hypothetical protein HYZ81_11355, partial [Nitrospinae bacterium]|nr:hypothetical protein [Nitrospinota bacterium]